MVARFKFIHMVPDANGSLVEVQDEVHNGPTLPSPHDKDKATVKTPDWRAAINLMSWNAELIAMHTLSIISAVRNDSSNFTTSNMARHIGQGQIPRLGREAGFRFGRGVYH